MWMRYACTKPSGGDGRTWRVLRRGSRRVILWFTLFTNAAWAVADEEADGEWDIRVESSLVRTYLSSNI